MSSQTSSFFSKIRIGRKSAAILLTLILLAIIGGGLYYYKTVYLPAQTTTDEPAMQTAVVRQGDLVIYASGTGTLMAESEAAFGFKASGQVTRINVRVGEDVKAGQALAELENASALMAYQHAQGAVGELTSPSAVATARESVANAKDEVVTTREELQYLISPAVQVWEERLAEAESALTEAQAEATAHPSTEASQKVQELQDTVSLAKAHLEEANKNYSTYLKENFSEKETNPRTGEERIIYYVDEETGKRYTNIYAPSETEIEVAHAAYDLAKATLTEAEIYLAAINGEEIPENAASSSLIALENTQAELSNAQDELENIQLIAPIDGTVMSLDFNVGDYVSSNSTTVTIANLNQPSIEVFLDESDWVNIALDYEVEVTFDILPERTFSGKVIQVDPGLYTENNSSVVRAIVRLDPVDESFHLPLGTSASVDVIGGRAENAVLIPVEALHQAGDQYTVFVVENGELKLRVVEVGIQDLLYAEILSGLEPGEVVSTGITETE